MKFYMRKWTKTPCTEAQEIELYPLATYGSASRIAPAEQTFLYGLCDNF